MAGSDEPAPDAVRGSSTGRAGRFLFYAGALVALAVVLAGGYYSEQIGSFFALQPWDRQGPLLAADAWRQGLQSSDEGLLKSVSSSNFTYHTEDGVISAVQADRQLGAIAAEHITPTAEAATGKVEYDYRGPQRHVVITLPSKSGGAVGLVLKRRDGRWLVTEFRALSADWLAR